MSLSELALAEYEFDREMMAYRDSANSAMHNAEVAGEVTAYECYMMALVNPDSEFPFSGDDMPHVKVSK